MEPCKKKVGCDCVDENNAIYELINLMNITLIDLQSQDKFQTFFEWGPK